MRAVAAEAERAMEKVMSAAEADLRKELGVPVVRQGGKVIRSRPGEYPRKDTGRLQASVTHVVYRAGNFKVRGVVSTNTSYDGYVNRTRPYKELFERKWRQEFPVRMNRELNQ